MDSSRFLHAVRGRLKGRIVLVLLAASTLLGQAAFESTPAVLPVSQHMALACSPASPDGSATVQGCSQAMSQTKPVDDAPRLELPTGGRACPASGPAAACNAGDSAAQPSPGVSSLPAGTSPCPAVPDKQGPDAPAACDGTVLPAAQPSESEGYVGSTFLPVRVTPSIPISTLAVAKPQVRVQLTSSLNALKPGQQTILTATAGASVTDTKSAIEIFDLSANFLVGACMQESRCQVAYAAQSGVHTFAAYITPPVAGQPAEGAAASSGVTVAWFGIKLTTSAPVVGPGKAVTFTATTTADVSGTGYQLGLFDQTSGDRLTFCSRGTACSTTLTKELAGSRSIVAYVATASETLPPPAVQAQSAPIKATWLGVTLDANTTHPQRGTTVFMRATANVDMAGTPWSIGIYDQNGDLVSNSCKSGTTCTARVSITTSSTPWFTAVIGAVRPVVDASGSTLVQIVRTAQREASLINIQARSVPVQPTRLLWGVDSCKPFTNDPTGAGGLYGQVKRYYGSPDFWGRYMTRTYNCPGISPAEIAAANYKKMGILPIYNDYDCSAVRTYNVGFRYANQATTAAAGLGIPQGTALAIDIEPYGEQCPGAARVDAGFVEGWYDGVMAAGYAPLYYGNGTAGSEFASAWCNAVRQRPELAANAYLWSFEPSLIGRFTKAKAPEYSPLQPGCAANMAVWQYVLSSGARPDVDSDEAISKLPLWFP